MGQQENLWQGGSWERSNPPIRPREEAPARQPSPRPGKKKRGLWRAAAVLTLAAVVLTFCAVMANHLAASGLPDWLPGRGTESGGRGSNPWGWDEDREYGEYNQTQVNTQAPGIPQAETGSGVTVALTEEGKQSLSYQEIYQKNTHSIVSIEVKAPDGYSTGTGIILDSDGYIVTNAHVVAGGESVRVIFRDNRWLEASLVGFEPQEDLAVLKVQSGELTPAEFGDSDLLEVGDPVAALGDPLGYRATLTDGIVSALNREVQVDDFTMNLIQTSAALNFGNSGGALLNQYGQVVGITTIKIATDDGSTEALGFAIPSQRVKFVVDRLIAGEEIRKAVIGVTVDTRVLKGGGMEVIEVAPDSDAAAKGVQPGDVILKVSGRVIQSVEDLSRVRMNRDVGDEVTLTILRDGRLIELSVRLIPAEE